MKISCSLVLNNTSLLLVDMIISEPSSVVYLSIVDMHADTIKAMSKVSSMLYNEYIEHTGVSSLIVAGDAKTYLRLKQLKSLYGSELQWLIPFIGDWHVLYNYQKVMMKVYYEAGLKNLAIASGHRAETLKSISAARELTTFSFRHGKLFLENLYGSSCFL